MCCAAVLTKHCTYVPLLSFFLQQSVLITMSYAMYGCTEILAA